MIIKIIFKWCIEYRIIHIRGCGFSTLISTEADVLNMHIFSFVFSINFFFSNLFNFPHFYTILIYDLFLVLANNFFLNFVLFYFHFLLLIFRNKKAAFFLFEILQMWILICTRMIGGCGCEYSIYTTMYIDVHHFDIFYIFAHSIYTMHYVIYTSFHDFFNPCVLYEWFHLPVFCNEYLRENTSKPIWKKPSTLFYTYMYPIILFESTGTIHLKF